MRRTFRGWSGALAAGLFALGCGPAGSVQVPSAPVGSIAGHITSLHDGKDLGGVTVSVLQVADKGPKIVSTTTADDGTYAIKDLAAGSVYHVRFSLDGYVPRFVNTLIPDTTGNYPQGNAVAETDTFLSPADASISGKVIANGGKPATGAVVGLDLRNQGFDLVTETTVDAAGQFSFAGLPGAPTGVQVGLVVHPYDDNADGVADYDAYSFAANAYPGVGTHVDIDLRNTATSLDALSSSLDDGQQHVTEPISLLFNRVLDPTRLTVSLFNNTQSRTVGLGYALDAAGTTLTVTPSGGQLTVGNTYQLNINARAMNGAQASMGRFFQAVGGGTVTLPKVTNLTLTSPLTTDWNTGTNAAPLFFSWEAVPGAFGYKVYAKDDHSNTSYVLLTTTGSSPSPTAALILPSSFDTFTADGYVTPFAFKAKLDFAVVAMNAFGDSADPSTATPLRRFDTVAPAVGGFSPPQQAGTSPSFNSSMDNSAGAAARTVLVTVQFTEYMDKGSPPVLTMNGAGVTSTFALNASLISGVYTVVVPAGVNGTGAYHIASGKDSSDNPMTQYNGTFN